MSNPKKQHYVPQVYLKNFSYISHKTPKLFVLSKSNDKIYPASVCDVGAEKDFYTLGSAEDSYVWERHYANNIEPLLSSVLKSIIKKCNNALIQDGTIILSYDEKIQVALSVIFQLLRGPQTRAFEKQIYDTAFPNIIDEIQNEFSPLPDSQLQLLDDLKNNNDFFKGIAMNVIFEEARLAKFLNIIINKTFVVYKIIGSDTFVTSDNPVIVVNANKPTTPFSSGIIDMHSIIYFPLSPKLLLAIYHPNLFWGGLRKLDSSLKILYGPKEENFISSHNRHQKSMCFNYIYSQTRTPLDSIL